MGIAIGDAKSVYSTTANVLSGGVRVFEADCLDTARIAIQPIFTGYTSVTVKLQVTLDGVNWANVSGAVTATSGNIFSANLLDDAGPYQSFAVHVTATASGSDSLAIWLRRQPHN